MEIAAQKIHFISINLTLILIVSYAPSIYNSKLYKKENFVIIYK